MACDALVNWHDQRSVCVGKYIFYRVTNSIRNIVDVVVSIDGLLAYRTENLTPDVSRSLFPCSRKFELLSSG